MSMYVKFTEWKSFLSERSSSLKKKSQISSVAKTLIWGLNNCGKVSEAEAQRIKELAQETMSKKSLTPDEIKVLEEAYNEISEGISPSSQTKDGNVSLAKKAAQTLVDSMDGGENLAVIDFEMTCCDENEIESEIIEFGVCIINLKSGQTIHEYSTLVKPVLNPTLTTFCEKLTGITNKDVELEGVSFDAALKEFQSKLEQHNVKSFIQWGCGDMRQLKKDHDLHNLDKSFVESLNVVDLKKPFSQSFGCRYRIGLKKAINIAGIERTSKAHRALPDAIETAKLAQLVYDRANL
ncbi:3'-5' exonuclease [Vibrio parahaemolyticus]|mgnify:CR=1 FL=1|uniref:3'-5' exonuclease n=1 Tax=Vibrio parahaemolyticus TaxID=670 RepID=A0AAW8PZ61_VIBPH|nr:3'-5' exonuclease [Vibrio parahaemolyticus]EGR2227521.1 hypothetical protein [Vibrio parahaemolyticus]MDS1821562.1 3'-5' exonuclease [Vibrio parahaemolyticus]